MLDPAALRARAIEEVLYQEAWRNERSINIFRGLIWICVGIAMLALNLPTGGPIQWTGAIHLTWGIGVLAFNHLWMKTRFHHTVPWVLTTVDVIVLVVGMQEGYLHLLEHEASLAPRHLTGVNMGLFLVVGLNMMRFSWRLSVWSAAMMIGAFLFVRLANDQWDRLGYIDIVIFSSFGAMLAFTNMRVRTILERIMLDLRQLQEDRLSSLASLVAGVAHEINTPLGALNANVQLTERALSILEEAAESPEAASIFSARPKAKRAIKSLSKSQHASRTAAERIDDVVTSLKNFARLDQAEVQIADIHEGLDSVVALVAPGPERSIEIIKSYGEVTPLSCQPALLNQVFMHLLKNAIEAIDEAGQITIRTAGDETEVTIDITDTGRGIEPDRLTRIFEPAFDRTGPRAKMGFGLSASQSIINDHGGTLNLESTVGAGTHVTIHLPR